MATSLLLELTATAVGATIGTMLGETLRQRNEIPVVEAEEVPFLFADIALALEKIELEHNSMDLVELPNTLIEDNTTSEEKIKISQFLQKDTHDSAFYLKISKIDDHQLLDKRNIEFDVDFDTIIKYFADEDLCSLRSAKIIEIICYFIDGYDDDLISKENRRKMRPYIPKVISIFKKFKNELNIAFICFRFIRFQCRTCDADRKLFISIIQPDNKLLAPFIQQNLRGQNLIDILDRHSIDIMILEEGFHAIGNIAINKELLNHFLLHISTLINIIKIYYFYPSQFFKYSSILETGISTLIKIAREKNNIIELSKFIPFFINILERHCKNVYIVASILYILTIISQYDEKNKVTIYSHIDMIARMIKENYISNSYIIKRLIYLLICTLTKEDIINPTIISKRLGYISVMIKLYAFIKNKKLQEENEKLQKENEELKSKNEELQSVKLHEEELKALNEDIIKLKYENEKLQAINKELQIEILKSENEKLKENCKIFNESNF